MLTRGSEHKVELPDGCEVDPPRLGNVGEFLISAVRRNALQLKREPAVWVEVEELVKSEETSTRVPKQSVNVIIERLARNQAALDRLRWPIWAIVLLLLLLYLK